MLGPMKTLKLWSGEGCFRRDPTSGCWVAIGRCYIAALNKAEAVALMRLAGFENFTRHEFDTHYSPALWGAALAGVKPVRGVWACRPGQEYGPEKPVKLI